MLSRFPFFYHLLIDKPLVFDFITSISFFCMEIVKHNKEAESFHCYFIIYLKLTLKTDTIICSIKNSYAAKCMLFYVNCLTTFSLS